MGILGGRKKGITMSVNKANQRQMQKNKARRNEIQAKARTERRKMIRLRNHMTNHPADNVAAKRINEGIGNTFPIIPSSRVRGESKTFKPNVGHIILAKNDNRLRTPMFLSAQHNHPHTFEQFVDGHHMVRHGRLKAITHKW